MNRFAPVEGSDLRTIEPVGGVFHVAGLIRSPHQLISIKWKVDNASGSTECEAWRGQHEIFWFFSFDILFESPNQMLGKWQIAVFFAFSLNHFQLFSIKI